MVPISDRHRSIKKELAIKDSLKLKVIFVVILAAASAALIYLYSGGDSIRTLPEELEGTWRCDDPRYEDRYFKLSPSTVALGIGNHRIFIHSIVRFEQQKIDNRTLFTVYYHDQDGFEQKMAFYYDASGEGAIQFKNQPEFIWHKSGHN